MIGHRQIIEYRKGGKVPAMVMVAYGEKPNKSPYDWNHPERQIDYGFYPTVFVDKSETPDLRFMLGLNVHASGAAWSDDYMEFLDRIANAKPKQIFANAYDENDALMVWRGGWTVCPF